MALGVDADEVTERAKWRAKRLADARRPKPAGVRLYDFVCWLAQMTLTAVRWADGDPVAYTHDRLAKYGVRRAERDEMARNWAELLNQLAGISQRQAMPGVIARHMGYTSAAERVQCYEAYYQQGFAATMSEDDMLDTWLHTLGGTGNPATTTYADRELFKRLLVDSLDTTDQPTLFALSPGGALARAVHDRLDDFRTLRRTLHVVVPALWLDCMLPGLDAAKLAEPMKIAAPGTPLRFPDHAAALAVARFARALAREPLKMAVGLSLLVDMLIVPSSQPPLGPTAGGGFLARVASVGMRLGWTMAVLKWQHVLSWVAWGLWLVRSFFELPVVKATLAAVACSMLLAQAPSAAVSVGDVVASLPDRVSRSARFLDTLYQTMARRDDESAASRLFTGIVANASDANDMADAAQYYADATALTVANVPAAAIRLYTDWTLDNPFMFVAAVVAQAAQVMRQFGLAPRLGAADSFLSHFQASAVQVGIAVVADEVSTVGVRQLPPPVPDTSFKAIMAGLWQRKFGDFLPDSYTLAISPKLAFEEALNTGHYGRPVRDGVIEPRWNSFVGHSLRLLISGYRMVSSVCQAIAAMVNYVWAVLCNVFQVVIDHVEVVKTFFDGLFERAKEAHGEAASAIKGKAATLLDVFAPVALRVTGMLKALVPAYLETRKHSASINGNLVDKVQKRLSEDAAVELLGHVQEGMDEMAETAGQRAAEVESGPAKLALEALASSAGQPPAKPASRQQKIV